MPRSLSRIARDFVWAALALLLVLILTAIAGCAQPVPAQPHPWGVFGYILMAGVGAIVLYNFGAIGRALWLWGCYYRRRRREQQLHQALPRTPAAAAAGEGGSS